jgi:hypothetical protein
LPESGKNELGSYARRISLIEEQIRAKLCSFYGIGFWVSEHLLNGSQQFASIAEYNCSISPAVVSRVLPGDARLNTVQDWKYLVNEARCIK